MSYDNEKIKLEKLQSLSQKLNKLIQEKEELKEKLGIIDMEIDKLLEEQREDTYEILNEPKNVDYVLAQDETTLFYNIGLLSSFQDYITRIERRISPRDIYILTDGYKKKSKSDIIQNGKDTFEENLSRIKEEFCKVYNALEKSGLLNDAFQVYISALTLLLSHNIPMALAAMIAGIIAKQGPKAFCR